MLLLVNHWVACAAPLSLQHYLIRMIFGIEHRIISLIHALCQQATNALAHGRTLDQAIEVLLTGDDGIVAESSGDLVSLGGG
jgi:hypothetical protein